MCALYGGPRARSFFRHHNRQLLNRIIAEEVLYYKISLAETRTNIYGESKNKMYFNPVLLTCLYQVSDQNSDDAEYGKSRAQQVDFRFLHEDLVLLNLLPEAGDIICWQESYYEVDLIIENQRVMGKNPDYSLQSDLEKYGESWSMICKSHLTAVNKLNIIKST
jgi:hypothetical protein